jgi:hypothetical protein
MIYFPQTEDLMRNTIILTVILGLAGLAIGYYLFGKFAGNYLEIKTLILPAKTVFGKIGSSIAGLEKIRLNIALCGLGGAAGGFILSLLMRRK